MIGLAAAAAAAGERDHRRDHPDAVSPLGVTYDWRGGETSLLRLVDSPVDDRVCAVVNSVRDSNAEEVDAVRTALTQGDNYTLLTFARRSAVLTLRADNPEPARTALLAAALVDLERIDFRDLPSALALPAFALVDWPEDVAEVTRRIDEVAQPDVASWVRRLLTLDWTDEDESNWGIRVVATPDGPALVDRGIDPWEPTLNLLAGACAVADALDADDAYITRSVTVGNDLPAIWLPSDVREGAAEILGRSAAAVSVSASPVAEDVHPYDHMCTCWLVETITNEEATQLANWVENDPPQPGRTILGLAAGRVFLILVTRSVVADRDGLETRNTIDRFRAPLMAALGAIAATSSE